MRPALRTTALLVLTGRTTAEITWLLNLSDAAFLTRTSEIRRRWRNSGLRIPPDCGEPKGDLPFGLLRRALVRRVHDADFVLATPDPDGHLLVMGSQKRGNKGHPISEKERNMFGKTRIGNICYYVGDIARTEAFYRDVLGLEVANMGDDGSGNDWLQASTEGGIDLIFFKQECRPGNSPIIVFDLVDVGIDTAVATLAERGATIVTPVSHAPGGWSAEFADPDGHVISMYQSEEVPRKTGSV